MQRAFKIYFAAVVMVLGGVSLLTNQKLYRFLVKPHFEFTVFHSFGPDYSVRGALRRRPIVWTISRLLIGWHIFYFSSETAERNSMKFDRKQDLNVFYKVCVFRADRKNNMAALASDWLRDFRLLLWNRWTEFNKT